MEQWMDGWSQSCKKIQSVLISQVMSVYTVKNCFSGLTCIITLSHKLVTLGLLIANRQLAYAVCNPSYHGENLFCSTYFDGQMLHRLLLQIRPVTEKRHSTGTDPADMPLIKQYVQQVAVTFLICSITFPKQK